MKRRIAISLFLMSFAGLSAGEEADASRNQGLIAKGTEWETPWFEVDSGVDGPVFLITGGTHGNEPAGAAAAEQIRHWPIVKGRLVVIPRMNRKALEAGTRRTPEIPKQQGDLNRVFPKTGGPDKASNELGSAIWEFTRDLKPDWVLDLHEGFAVNRINSKSVGSSILCNPRKETKPLFEHALAAVNASIEDPKNLFLLHSQNLTVNGGLTRAAMERLGAEAAILETTYQGFPLGVRVRQHRLMVNRILRDLGMVKTGPDDLVFEPEGSKRIRVAIYIGPGVGGSGPKAVENQLAIEPKKFVSKIIGPTEVRNGALEQFDVVVFPGGSGSKQAGGIGEKGRQNVREFVESGKGYLGICAGCYLACENFSWSLKILDAKTRSSKWRRGRKQLDLSFAREAVELLGLNTDSNPVLYVNGPVMEAAHSPGIPDFTTLATFATEVADNDSPKGLQVGTPAILTGSFGKGRVVGISPHPEQTDGLRMTVPRLIEWCMERE